MPPKKKAAKKGGLPHIDRSRSLPVRADVGFWKVLGLGMLVGGIVYACNGPHESAAVTEPPAVVVPR